MNEMVKYLKAMLVLQAEIVAKTKGAEKPEVLLDRAELSHKEIAGLVGKSQPAVSKSISRARTGRKDRDDE